MSTLISFILVFGLLVFFHEFGHFAIAKLNNIKVHEFALGMGPQILKYKGKETLYAIRLFPIGGFVRMEGEDEVSEDIRSFNKKTPLQRFSVIAAGPFMNIILAILLFSIIAMSLGMPVNKIDEVTNNFPAKEAGLASGDRIIEIDGVKIKTWDDILNSVNNSKEDILQIKVIRNEEILKYQVKPKFDQTANKNLIGITPVLEKSFYESLKFSVDRVLLVAGGITDFLSNLVKGKASAEEVVGPIGMVHFVGEAAKTSIYSLLSLAAVISINLAIVNILPFPALDGGRLIFIIIEIIKGKPINPEKEGFVHFVGFIVLIVLMVFVIYKDIIRFNLL